MNFKKIEFSEIRDGDNLIIVSNKDIKFHGQVFHVHDEFQNMLYNPLLDVFIEENSCCEYFILVEMKMKQIYDEVVIVLNQSSEKDKRQIKAYLHSYNEIFYYEIQDNKIYILGNDIELYVELIIDFLEKHNLFMYSI